MKQHSRTVRIESIAKGGDGVAHEGGRAIFVPRTAPGDLVEITVEAAGGAQRGHVLRVLEPGPDRVAPPCRFVDACGGCDLMHLAATARRDAHRAIVRDALARIGGVAALPEIVSHAAHEGEGLGYRTRARLFAVAKRGKVVVGFRSAGSHNLAAIDRCVVLAPALDAAVRALPDMLSGANGDGEISIALGDRGLPVVDVAWRGTIAAATWAKIDGQIQRAAWAGARVLIDGAKAAATFGDPRPVARGADGQPLLVAAGGFAQPSDEAAALLARRAAALVAKSGAGLTSIVELYAGCGTLSILLAPLTSRLVAIESDEGSAAALRQNLAARGLAGKVTCADAGSYDIGRADVVVLDPPRTGAKEAVAKITASAARAVVYVSCEPTTLARDVAALTAAGFTVTDVETADIFPQTSHTEVLVRLTRGGTRKRSGG